jgi:hypothetical protein
VDDNVEVFTLFYRQTIKIIVKCVNKAVKLFYVIRAQEHTILCVSTQSWKKPQKANGRVLTAKERECRNRMMMNTWNSAGTLKSEHSVGQVVKNCSSFCLFDIMTCKGKLKLRFLNFYFLGFVKMVVNSFVVIHARLLTIRSASIHHLQTFPMVTGNARDVR